jgi:hypothetical protein
MAVLCGNCSHGFCESYALVEILSSSIFASVVIKDSHGGLVGMHICAVLPHCIQLQSSLSGI